MTTAYPLAWPEGWPRTPAHKRQDSKSRFSRYGEPWTLGAARDALTAEVRRLGARNLVISTNYELRLDGLLRAAARVPEDRGVAIYFLLKGRPQVMACDMHVRAEENMRSLTLAIEAMRQLERHGGGLMMEKAFAGFTALPAPKRPHEVLGIEPGASAAEVQKAWRSRIAGAHPDQGGSQGAAAEINAARDAMLRAPA